jgi:hypothetical protein
MAAVAAVFSAVAAAAEIATGPPDPDRYVASPLLLSPEVHDFKVLGFCFQPRFHWVWCEVLSKSGGAVTSWPAAPCDLAAPARCQICMF